MARHTIISCSRQFKRSFKVEIFFFRGTEVNALKMNSQLPLLSYDRIGGTLKANGWVTTALRSTVSTKGSRRATSLMQL